MNSSSRVIAVHHRSIESFLHDAVELVLERLDEQMIQAAPCVYSEDVLRSSLRDLLEPLQDRYEIDAQSTADQFTKHWMPLILDACRKDFERYPIQDPALSNLEEVFYASNGFWATIAYRIANALKRLRVPLIPRAISSIAHSKTGVDIHPAATIGPGLFIDHGTGIAIGCTAVLEQDVSLYNGVVLGTRSKPRKKTAASGGIEKRHPTIQAGVSLYTNAFVGGDVVIGEGAVIGAYAFVCHDVPAGTVVTGQSDHDGDARANIKSATKPEQDIAADTAEVAPGILGLIGNTPVVQIQRLHDNPNVKIFAKLEGANPSGSVKDRVALALIEGGEKSGALTHDKVILESTSGNTGIGLAMVGAAKGYQVVLTMSSAMSEERKKVLRAFGATLIETDPQKGTGGAIEKARQMVRDEPEKYWMANQHASLDNPRVHANQTAVEILNQVPDVTHFVAGIGTFGTLRGAGVRLREEVGAKVIGVEPIMGDPIQGLRNMKEPFAPELYDESLLDLKMSAVGSDAYDITRQLAEKEGLLVGMSSGAAMHGALRLAESLDEGVIVVVLPDRGEKYLSTSLFGGAGTSSATTNSGATQADRGEPSIAATDSLADPAVETEEHVFAYSI